MRITIRTRRARLFILAALDAVGAGVVVGYWFSGAPWDSPWGSFVSGIAVGLTGKWCYYGWRHFAEQDSDRS